MNANISIRSYIFIINKFQSLHAATQQTHYFLFSIWREISQKTHHWRSPYLPMSLSSRRFQTRSVSMIMFLSCLRIVSSHSIPLILSPILTLCLLPTNRAVEFTSIGEWHWIVAITLVIVDTDLQINTSSYISDGF